MNGVTDRWTDDT